MGNSSNKGTILIGPWGDPKRKSLHFTPAPGTKTSITEIEIGHANVVHFLRFKSFDHTTKSTKQSEQWGAGLANAKVNIHVPTEYLTKISGTTTKINEVVVVESLTFYTNTNKSGYGPYGPTTGTAFEVPLENGEVVGFFGNAGDFINAIGIHVIPHAP